MKKQNNLRRSGAKIMASLILLLGSLAYIMVLAVINGSLGFLSAMGVTVFGTLGMAKPLVKVLHCLTDGLSVLPLGAVCFAEYSVILSNIPITISHSNYWRSSAIKYLPPCADFALQSWRARKKAVLSLCSPRISKRWKYSMHIPFRPSVLRC